MPFFPRTGSQEIMRMMLEVQNGTVHSRNNPICQSTLLDVEDQEVGYVEAEHERDQPKRWRRTSAT